MRSRPTRLSFPRFGVETSNSGGFRISDDIFKVVYLICFIAGCAVRAASLSRVPRWWRDRQTVTSDGTTALDALLVGLASIGLVVLPLVYALTSRLDFADYQLPHPVGLAARAAGVAVFSVAFWLLWKSHVDLGANFSPELKIRREHSLVTRGVYGRIRHPMYAAHWLWAVAQALLLQNWIAGPSMLAVFLPFYLVRVPREERMLLAHFGDEYRAYINRTGRIIPHFRR